MQSTSKGCAPSSAGVAVTTTYSFDDTSANKDQFVVQRQFSFGQKPFDHDFRPYIPRFSLALGFTDVLYPAIGGELASMDARNCPYGCTGPFPAQGAAPLDAQWDSSQQWYAIHNPATGQGVVVMRQRALGADGALDSIAALDRLRRRLEHQLIIVSADESRWRIQRQHDRERDILLLRPK